MAYPPLFKNKQITMDTNTMILKSFHVVNGFSAGTTGQINDWIITFSWPISNSDTSLHPWG